DVVSGSGFRGPGSVRWFRVRFMGPGSVDGVRFGLLPASPFSGPQVTVEPGTGTSNRTWNHEPNPEPRTRHPEPTSPETTPPSRSDSCRDTCERRPAGPGPSGCRRWIGGQRDLTSAPRVDRGVSVYPRG